MIYWLLKNAVLCLFRFLFWMLLGFLLTLWAVLLDRRGWKEAGEWWRAYPVIWEGFYI